jgi:diacylglycerol kinase
MHDCAGAPCVAFRQDCLLLLVLLNVSAHLETTAVHLLPQQMTCFLSCIVAVR